MPLLFLDLINDLSSQTAAVEEKMKRVWIAVMLLAFASLACGLGADSEPTETLVPDTPEATLTPTIEPTPEPQLLSHPTAGFELVLPGSYTFEDFSTGYDQGAVLIKDQDGDFTVMAANVPSQGFSLSSMVGIISLVYESNAGLKMDMSGLAVAYTRQFDITLAGAEGRGFGFTGTLNGEPVEGEVFGVMMNDQDILVIISHINTDDDPNAWANTGMPNLEELLNTLQFTQ
jgi:hypothetical protein